MLYTTADVGYYNNRTCQKVCIIWTWGLKRALVLPNCYPVYKQQIHKQNVVVPLLCDDQCSAAPPIWCSITLIIGPTIRSTIIVVLGWELVVAHLLRLPVSTISTLLFRFALLPVITGSKSTSSKSIEKLTINTQYMTELAHHHW